MRSNEIKRDQIRSKANKTSKKQSKNYPLNKTEKGRERNLITFTFPKKKNN